MVANLNFFGDDAAFDHVGIAVSSVNDFLKNERITDPIQNVNIILLSINGFGVELVEPVNESSPVMGVLRRQQSLYHVCFRVQDIELAIEAARKHGFHCIARPVCAVAFNNKRIAWVFSRTYGLFELLEK